MSARDLAIWGRYRRGRRQWPRRPLRGVSLVPLPPSREFWLGLARAQALALAYAVLVGVLVLENDHPASNLYYLYALLPIAIGFVAEQLRLVAADQVLSGRDLDDAKQVALLPPASSRRS